MPTYNLTELAIFQHIFTSTCVCTFGEVPTNRLRFHSFNCTCNTAREFLTHCTSCTCVFI